MVDKFIKNYNDLFLEEINDIWLVQKHIGKLTTGDISKLHVMVAEGILHLLYAHFPTILIFNPYFFIFSNTRKHVDYHKEGAIKEKSKFEKFTEGMDEKEINLHIEKAKKRRFLSRLLFSKHKY